jgi:hypothetical protein
VTYTSPTVPTPASLPFDLPAVAGAALDVLRLDPTDDDAERVQTEAERACRLVELELDYAVAPATVDPLAVGAAVMLTVELYRRKDAPFGVTDAWSVDGASIRVSADVMRTVRAELSKIRQRRAVA